MTTKDKYIELKGDCFIINKTRVSLDSVIYAFKEGLSPETIATECLPILTLEQVYGAITFYLANRKDVDAYLKQNEARYEELREKTLHTDPEFYQKFMQARRQTKAVGAWK